LLLDEPTRSLDPVATEHFHDQLSALVRSRGTAVLVATHDLYEAASIASRALLMRRGRVEVASAPGEAPRPEALAQLLSERGE
jgi:ABC-2 type transport system ATP-binding protein